MCEEIEPWSCQSEIHHVTVTGAPSTFLSDNKYNSGFCLGLFFSVCQTRDLQFAPLLPSAFVGSIIRASAIEGLRIWENDVL